MSDLEFLARLQVELSGWSDIHSVRAAPDDPELSENELRVIPADDLRSRFRVIVEWETAP